MLHNAYEHVSDCTLVIWIIKQDVALALFGQDCCIIISAAEYMMKHFAYLKLRFGALVALQSCD